jgi:hypothetical protein
VVDIFPDEGEGGVWAEGGDKEHDADYQNKNCVVTEFGEHTDCFGGDADASSYAPNGYIGGEEGGVVGVYNSTPEFLAVVPFSNSCVSFL